MHIRVVREKRSQGDKLATQEPAQAARKPSQDLAQQEFGHPVKRFTISATINRDGKKFEEVKDSDGNVTDYKDVTIEGYLSTFQGTTPSDRDGDYVEKGAFEETLKRFMENPVMLRDHAAITDEVAGSFTEAREDETGLYVKGMLSNSPDNRWLRFKVAEGHITTMSMGGIFHYRDDGRGIFKVELYEGSLTPIPANPDARFQTRSLTEEEVKMLKGGPPLKHKPAPKATDTGLR